MSKAVVFAGTTEGRKVTEFLCRNHIEVTVSVATEYGGECLLGIDGCNIRYGKLDREEICRFLQEENPKVVVDATHLYAVEITENVKRACEKSGFSYLRILRATSEAKGAVYVDSEKEAAEYLNGTEGNILLTTGSKELNCYTAIKDYKERCFARVLSLPQVVEACDNLGFRGSHLIAMQGPFSQELNKAILKQVHASYLVTKESGQEGGFEEKVKAAEECGVNLVVIGKRKEESGDSLEEGLKKLEDLFGFCDNQQIAIVGIGMGNRNLLTAEASQWIKEADLLVGAERVLKAVDTRGKQVFFSYRAKDIEEYVKGHIEYQKVALLVSGDVGLFSAAKTLLEIWPDAKMIPGISSLEYFLSRLHSSWEDVACASLHGRVDSVISMLKEYGRIFVILGENHNLSELCSRLCDCDLGRVKVSVGEDLSYPQEKITVGRASEFQNTSTSSLSVCLLELEMEAVCTYGIEDEEFFRYNVPMTKEEIRCIVLSKLKLTKKAVVYDIGAGTGSISVELARVAWQGQVFAIEQKALALELIWKNTKAFGVENLNIIEGRAPKVLEDLPMPTHAFIGGSDGSLKEIIDKLLEKNPNINIVFTAVSLETIGEATKEMKRLEKCHGRKTEIVAVSVAKAKVLDRYHMMMGENPVYIFTSVMSPE